MSLRLVNKMLSFNNIFILLTLLLWHVKYTTPPVSTSYHVASALTFNSYEYVSFILIILSSYLLFQVYLYSSQEDII